MPLNSRMPVPLTQEAYCFQFKADMIQNTHGIHIQTPLHDLKRDKRKYGQQGEIPAAKAGFQQKEKLNDTHQKQQAKWRGGMARTVDFLRKLRLARALQHQ